MDFTAGDANRMAELPTKVTRFMRPAHLPVTEPAEFGARSGFGGSPYLAAGVEHPACPRCGNPMALFVQLRLDELPEAIRPAGEGLIQLLYCITLQGADRMCEIELGAGAPFAAGEVVRMVAAEGGSVSPVPPAFPPQRITGWYTRPDVPSCQELEEELGVDVEDELMDRLLDLQGKFGGSLPRPGDKMGGWPAWVQAVEYPDCTTCGRRMSYVIQIDSEDHIPYMFQDGGTGHVAQCQAHPDVLTFGWACG
jgi:hypothetical protein